MSTPQVTIRFASAVRYELDAMAAKKGMTRAGYIRQAILSQLATQLAEQAEAEQKQEKTPH
jgi:predicted transcriptional regulator